MLSVIFQCFVCKFSVIKRYLCAWSFHIQIFAPIQDVERFVISSQPEEGRDKCPYGPTTGYTALIIGKAVKINQSLLEFQ